ncbi:amino acid adenylation domain-containing protein [Thalassospira povalilytica]|uniref:amino acid adenylation domain-containing protein n=1 Tax=Thalassospira povalilytica TaxID=732237 RepID=UPI003AA95E64
MKFQHEYFEETADKWPDHIAIDDHGHTISYGELEAYSNQIAHVLASQKVSCNDRVILFTGKNIDSYAALLGILKAGATWVPFSLAFPEERLKYLLETLRPKAIIFDDTTKGVVEILSKANVSLLNISLGEVVGADSRIASVKTMPTSRLKVSTANLEDLAYIIFTSGSTGHPKGVMVKHLNTSLFIEAAVEYFCFPQQSRFAHLSEFTFDPSVFDIFYCWASGGTLVPFNKKSYRINPAIFFQKQNINVMFSVPSILEALDEIGALEDEALQSIERILLTGEPVKEKLLATLHTKLPKASIYNMYGTTETAIVSHWCKLEPGEDYSRGVPVGRPLPTVRVYLMDGDHEVADGEVGESVVYGAQVSPGYWANKFLTDQVFVDNLIEKNLPQKMYRTGDLLRRDADGNHFFVGRADTMVKVRGHRVELSEIESQLRLHDAVDDAVVLLSEGGKGAFDRQLVAFVKCVDEEPEDLRNYLVDRLPSYMVPSKVRPILHDFPRNPNGKIDKIALGRLAESILMEKKNNV